MAFVDEASERLGLNPQERAFVLECAVTSFDALHALLEASPSLDRDGGIRRGALLAAMLANARILFSPAYAAALLRPAVPYTPLGAQWSAPPMPLPGDDDPPIPPADWPARGRPVGLVDAKALDLLGPVMENWPLRDQGTTPTCVGFAAAAALERISTHPGAAPQPLSAIFLYRAMRDAMARDPGRKPPGAAQGATKLTRAAEILASTGICPEQDWPDDRPPGRAPSAAARATARRMNADCWDLGVLTRRWPGPARAVWELLARGRPVAISLPEFRDPDAGPRAPTNWGLRLTWATGQVPDPPPHWRPARIGHAVCILGFQPVVGEPLGGWFVFRNSLGLRFAADAPDPFAKSGPIVPGDGYGVISARHINRFVYEIFAPR